jgi:hypothetical protein
VSSKHCRGLQEQVVNLVEAILMAGFCVMIAGAAFLFIFGLKARRRNALMEFHSSGQFDLFMLFVWGGLLLVQFSSILLHWDPGATRNLSSLSWTGTGSTIFVCGVFAGRLLLRLEMHRYKEKREGLRPKRASLTS